MTQSPNEIYQELFEDVQISRIFPDSKTFCDAIPRRLTPNEILERYRQEKAKLTFDLSSFVSEHFIIPSAVTNTTIVNEKWTIVEHCHRLWPLLTRTVTKENYSSLIEVPHPFVVPGGRFREFYYWDTYFTMLGLIRSKETKLANDMLENFAFLIRTIGHIPGGNRSYYLNQSQPPFFSLMTELLGQTEKYQNELEMEYEFWMKKRAVTLDDGTILNRYYDDRGNKPRPEAFVEDFETAYKSRKKNVYFDLTAAGECGWDFSSRWMVDETDLSTTITTSILPVDLNCLLHHLELAIGKTSEAERRYRAIQKYMWSDQLNFFTDYNFIKKEPTNRLALAGLFPIWLRVSTEQAKHVTHQIESLFLHGDGLVIYILMTN